MAKALTDARLKTLAPGDYTDGAARGLQFRVHQGVSVSRYWLFRFRWRGQGVRIVLGRYPATSLAEARSEAATMRRWLDDGIDPRRANRRATRQPLTKGKALNTVAALADEFMRRHVEPQRKQPEYVRRILDADVLPYWGERDARTITPREVVELLDGIVDRGSKIMANRVAGVLSQMFRFGLHRALLESSPVQLLYRPGGKEKSRDRALSDTELGALLVNLDPVMGARSRHFAHAARVLLLTGQRRGEIAAARWRDVHLTGAEPTWTIPAEASKTGVAHEVPLTAWAVREFEALRRKANGNAYVLPAGAGHIDPKLLTRSVARYQEAFAEHGIEKFTLHDLRRSCRTGLAKLKVKDEVAERVLNHATPGMRGVYNRHDYLLEMRAALNKWAGHLSTLHGRGSR